MRDATWCCRTTFLLACVAASTSFAQRSAAITGTVTDAATGKPVPGVTVTATSPALQAEVVLVTDAAGVYHLAQLPPGAYTLVLEQESFRPVTRPGVELHADRTVRVNDQLQPDTAPEAAPGRGAPSVDVGSTAAGLTVGRAFLERIPFLQPDSAGARSFEGLAAVAPQTLPDRYGVGFSGAQSPENDYLVDGVSVGSPAYGVNGARVPVEFLEEANVLTGGLPAELGRTTGGLRRVVTRSGSNQFHGSVWGEWSPGLLTGDAKTPVDRDTSMFVQQRKPWNTVDVGGTVSGPIIKDRLWFFAGFSPSFRRVQSTQTTRRFLLNSAGDDFLYDGDGYIQTQEIPGTRRSAFLDDRAFSYLVKLTLQLTAEHTVSLSVLGSPGATLAPVSFSPRQPGSTALGANSTTVALNYSGAFLDRHLLADATVGYFRLDSSTTASDGSRLGATPGDGTMMGTPTVIFDRSNPHPITDFEGDGLHALQDAGGEPYCEGTGARATRVVTVRGTPRYLAQCPATGDGINYLIGGPGYVDQLAADRLQGRVTLTWLMQALGHHAWKVGLEAERAQDDVTRGLSGGTLLAESGSGSTFYDYRQFGYFTGPDQAKQQVTVRSVPVSLSLGAFVQDTWRILDVLTLHAGLRWENQQLFAGDGTLGLTLNNMLSPRVGLSWDFTGQGRSRLFASYAHYYEAVPLDLADRSLSGESQVRFYRYAAPGPSRQGCNLLADLTQVLDQCADPNNYRVNYLGSKTPYDVSQAGYMTGQGKTPVDPALQPQSVHELLVGAEYELPPWGRLGVSYTHRAMDRVVEDMSLDEGSTYFVSNPGYGMGAPMPRAVRDYDAVTASFTRPFGDGWLAQLSYTWSSLRGNYNGLFRPESGQLDPNATSDFDLISLMRNRSGPLGADANHAIKAYASKELVLGGGVAVLIGLAYEGYSGTPLNLFAGTSWYGPSESFLLPRGSGGRLPWRHTVNAKLGVSYRLFGDTVVSLTVDVFNLFNFQAVTDVDQTFTSAAWLPIRVAPGQDPLALVCLNQPPTCVLPRGDSASEVNPSYKRPTSYQAPISARVGLKLTF